MRTPRLSELTPLLDPGHAGWRALPAESIAMIATPIGLQPTAYVRNAWQSRAYGQTTPLTVRSAHDGEHWALHAEWSGVSAAGHDFPDALALALPVVAVPPLALMGTSEAPIHILRWQSDKHGVASLWATGIGHSAPGPVIDSDARSHNDGTHWQVVITRKLSDAEGLAPLLAGHETRIGFALWRGDNDERAGIKAFSVDWQVLTLDP